MFSFSQYNEKSLFDKIDALKIYKQDNFVITKYYDRVINTTKVSDRYEIFDISSFLKNKISNISTNFNIYYYKFIVRKGTQELVLLSDKVDINGSIYYKSFFILNSTDKSRKLNLNLGLYRSDNNTYLISGINNMSLTKKHLTGVTKLAEEASISINGETFNDQISSLKSLVGERIMLSKLKEVIVDKDQQINHQKFDAFKNQILYSNLQLSRDQQNLLRTRSTSINITYTNDFSIDAYLAFGFYMQIFRTQDSYIVKKETEKILKITQCFIRKEKLEKILFD